MLMGHTVRIRTGKAAGAERQRWRTLKTGWMSRSSEKEATASSKWLCAYCTSSF